MSRKYYKYFSTCLDALIQNVIPLQFLAQVLLNYQLTFLKDFR